MIFSTPTLLDNVQAQTNATNATSSSMQNQTAQAAAAGQNQTAQAAAAGQNQTAQAAAGQNQTMSQNAQALMAVDIPELKDDLSVSKLDLSNGNIEEALTGITGIENQLLLLQNKTTFTGDFSKIKESLSKGDFAKALDDITNVKIKS